MNAAALAHLRRRLAAALAHLRRRLAAALAHLRRRLAAARSADELAAVWDTVGDEARRDPDVLRIRRDVERALR